MAGTYEETSLFDDVYIKKILRESTAVDSPADIYVVYESPERSNAIFWAVVGATHREAEYAVAWSVDWDGTIFSATAHDGKMYAYNKDRCDNLNLIIAKKLQDKGLTIDHFAWIGDK